MSGMQLLGGLLGSARLRHLGDDSPRILRSNFDAEQHLRIPMSSLPFPQQAEPHDHVKRMEHQAQIALERAQNELASVTEQAAEEGYPVPDQEQIERASFLLREVFRMVPADYTVYPTPNSEIAIDVTTDDISIVLYSHADGAAECFVDTDESQSHAWYRNSEEVLGAFLQEALAKLRPRSGD